MKRKIFSKLLMGAFLIASVSMFVSCKDYDDDISKNSQEITALKSQLESLKSSLSSELSAAKSELNNALANKANASDLDKKANSSDLTALEARVAALETQIKAIDECATKSDLDAVKATLAALTGELDKAATPDDIAKAVEAQNKIQSEALEAFKKEVESKGYLTEDALTQLKADVKELQDKLAKIDVNAAIEDLQKKSQALLDELTKKINDQVATMKLFVTAKLTSVVLKPTFYWEGIEGIEVPILRTPKLEPIKNYEFSYKVKDAPLGDQIVKVVVDEVMSLPVTDPKGKYTNIILETYDGTEKVNGKGGKAFPANEWGGYYAYNYWDIMNGHVKTDGDAVKRSIDYDKLQAIAQGWEKDGKKGSLEYKNIQKPGLANYHINPVMANIEGAKIEFYTNLAEVYTRSGDAAIQFNPIVGEYTKSGEVANDPYHTNIFKDGILTIPFEVNDYGKLETYFSNWTEKNYTKTFTGYEPTWTAKDAEGNADAHDGDNAYGSTPVKDKDGNIISNATAPLPFLAVQLTTFNKEGAVDTVVTSDYAVVVPAKVKIIALADKDPNVKLDEETFIKKHNGFIRNNHLYETVGYTNGGANVEEDNGSYGAIPMPATHSVAWNDTIDISKFIETHANYITYTRYGQSVEDKAMTPAELTALGLHYEYKAIDYRVGKNKTSESMHIRQIDGTETGARSGLFTPVAVEVQEDGSGKPYADNHQSRNTIEREPLIRVDLVDTDGDIVRYGYIKLRIVDTEQANMEVTVNFPEQYMNCGFEVRMTWAQVEDLILHRLGDHGFTKQEFEKAYYLDVEGFAGGVAGNSWEVMPATKEQTYTKKTGTVKAPDGTLEETWAAAKDDARWWAKRFYKAADGKYYPAIGKNTEKKAFGYKVDKDGKDITDETSDNSGKPFTASNNWFGRVWYTPHDNSTDTHAWDESTNVLRWIVTNQKDASNMNKARIENMRAALGVNYSNPNKSTEALSTVVRFVNKTTGSYIYVTLNIPVVYFNYGEVQNKDWSHWFKFNGGLWGGAYHDGLEGKSTATAPYWEEFDTHVNPHKPSNVEYLYLNPQSLTQRLTDFWLDPANMVKMNGGDNFSMFKADGDGKKLEGTIKAAVPDVTFIFTYPEKDLNSTEATAAKKELPAGPDGKGNKTYYTKKTYTIWDVKGASGTVWSLTIGAHSATRLADNADVPAGNTAIYAVGKNGKAYGPEEVAYLDGDAIGKAKNPIIHYRGLEAAKPELYPAATDLINLSGAYDARGNERFTRGGGLAGISQADYLEANVDETFTAYIKMDVKHGCYDPFVTKQYFNVRIYRPINVAGLEVEWYDRVLADNTLDIKDLVEVVDWNDFAVVPFGAAAVKERNTVFGIERPKYADVFQDNTRMKATNAGIPFEYYGISQLAVRYDEIRTDHAMEVGVRNNVYYDEESILKNTTKVCDLPSLKSPREKPDGYRTLTLLNANGSIVDFGTAHAWAHSQKNADGSTKFGKIYYNNDAGTVQLFHIYVPIAVKYNWGNIAWDDTLGDQPGVKLDKDYTQKVWAVITVNATHKK